MSERRVSDDVLAQLWACLDHDGADTYMDDIALDLRDARATLATTQAALKDAEEKRDKNWGQACELHDALGTTLKVAFEQEARADKAEAALKSARAEIAAAERRGMERCISLANCEIERRQRQSETHGAVGCFTGDLMASAGISALAEHVDAIRTAALPPPSDAAPAASEVAS